MIPIVTYFDEKYAPGYKMMIRSFLKYNDWFKDYVLIFDWGISEKTYLECKQIYERTDRISFDKHYYYLKDSFINKHYYAQNFQKFEIFNILHHCPTIEKIVVLDADLLITDDISGLFCEFNDGFYVDTNRPTKWEKKVPFADTGVMVIDRKFLKRYYYIKCINKMNEMIHRYAGTKNPVLLSNEWVFDKIFKKLMNPLPDEYCQKEVENFPDCKILGAPPIKPWYVDKRWNKMRERLPWDTAKDPARSMKFRKIANEVMKDSANKDNKNKKNGSKNALSQR
jgi:lipopolysaccharide biosynthesis glycosyltransferase